MGSIAAALVFFIYRKAHIVAMGYFNIPLQQSYYTTRELTNIMQSYDLQQTIFAGTHTAMKNCIDNMLTSVQNFNSTTIGMGLLDQFRQSLRVGGLYDSKIGLEMILLIGKKIVMITPSNKVIIVLTKLKQPKIDL